MPNIVTNRVKITGPTEKLREFREKHIRTDEHDTRLDFQTVIPMPKLLEEAPSSSHVDRGLVAHGITSRNVLHPDLASQIAWEVSLINRHGKVNIPPTQEALTRWVKNNDREAWEAGERAARLIKEYGHASWYGWAIDKWGTKWNSTDYEEIPAFPGADESRQFEFRFGTAWSHPAPIFKKLAEMYPELRFEVVCLDEGFNFAGLGCYNGTPEYKEFTEEEPFPRMRALYEMLHGEPLEIAEN